MEEIPQAQIEKLTNLLDEYCFGNLPKVKLSPLKGSITRLINVWSSHYGAIKARETAFHIVLMLRFGDLGNERLNLWLNRLSVGSLYHESDRVFGWYNAQEQTQAEHIPVTMTPIKGIVVNFFGFHKEQALWESRGFFEAVQLPWHRYEFELEVTYHRYCRHPEKWAFYWACWGYAKAEEIPYKRTEDKLEVIYNNKNFGWWKAYKWWEGCKSWYFDKHPEWWEGKEDN